jgi:hypothetical protein
MPLEQSAGEIEYLTCRNAMEILSDEHRTTSVGAISGNIIVVVDARISIKLEYMQSVGTSFTPEEGLSGYTLLAANEDDPRGVGLYYRSGKMGFIMVVGDQEPCHKEYADTLDNFIKLAGQKYGLKLTGGTW